MRTPRKLLITSLALSLTLLLTSSPALANEEAEAAFERGTAVLTQGDFDGALAAYVEAAKADPENQDYRKQLALVHRVKQVRAQLAASVKDDTKWEATALSLRTFYLQYQVFGEAVALDEARHARFHTPATAIDLSESYLEHYQDAAAAKVLAALAPTERTVRANVMLGIAAARIGDLPKAKRLAAAFGRGDQVDTQLLYDRACLSALVGDLPTAADQLRTCFEGSPAASLVRLKTYTKTRKDLDRLRTPKYAAVFETASKVKAAGCAGCSSAATCGEAKTDEAGCGDDAAGDCADGKN